MSGAQYVMTCWIHGTKSEHQKGYATRTAAAAAARTLKRRHGSKANVSVDFVPDNGGPFCPVPELSDASLAAEIAAEAATKS